MAYCRPGELGSDVYAYSDGATFHVRAGDEAFQATTLEAFRAILEKLAAAGRRVPRQAFERIDRELGRDPRRVPLAALASMPAPVLQYLAPECFITVEAWDAENRALVIVDEDGTNPFAPEIRAYAVVAWSPSHAAVVLGTTESRAQAAEVARQVAAALALLRP